MSYQSIGDKLLDISSVKALTFDVFGTVVDWRSSLIREGKALGKEKGLKVDWEDFADAWRRGYGPSMNRVRKGELPWTKIDGLHRMILDELLKEFQITGLIEKEIVYLNRAWHRLNPWPDVIDGLNRLRSRFLIVTLSNGDVELLTHMAKNAGLQWDCILSAELVRHYKPDPEVYQMAAQLLGLPPEQVMMVAAHLGDLKASAEVGFRTAFVSRPKEHGSKQNRVVVENTDVDIRSKNFEDLADQLEC